ncbi:MAG: threonine synthase [Clostridiales bacterium]|nr:threonine synthase [Clostridiales bacterium]
MKYTSTRDKCVNVSAAKAITTGISPEGGLFVPQSLPKLNMEEISSFSGMTYVERAEKILSLFLTDFSQDEIAHCARSAYGSGNFSDEKTAPLVGLEEGLHILELWKGPTAAFKDMALQILPHLLKISSQKTAEGMEIVILVATSGDTGKAALEGFKDVEGTKIVVFYPDQGVSPMQKLQMATQEGGNVEVCAIEGNFDDAQSGVKRIFTDSSIKESLRRQGMMFSSANSINWGRLLPQIVYYFSAYADLLETAAIKTGQKVNFVVPTGNFGNILAAYYAMQMGLPVNRLVCASNANNVLTDFINTGVYDRRREFYATSSPSMDILISSNLERLLYDLSGCDDQTVKALMNKLAQDGIYEVEAELLTRLQADFSAGFCDDEKTKKTIAKTFKKYGYLSDTHTAVGLAVYEDYKARTGDDTVTVIASTASPFKFGASVLEALQPGERGEGDEFARLESLQALTGQICPPPLMQIKGKPIRFEGVCPAHQMSQRLLDLLGVND